MSIFFLGSRYLTILLSLILIISLFSLVLVKNNELPGTAVPVDPPQKITKGDKHPPYKTNPPTSGWYIESNTRDGVFTGSLPDEQIVDALINGKIVIAYSCTAGDLKEPSPPPQKTTQATSSAKPTGQSREEQSAIWEQVRTQNQSCGTIISALRKIIDKKGKKDLILTIKSNLDTRVALVAWGRLDKLHWVDENRISKFIDAWRGKKPE